MRQFSNAGNRFGGSKFSGGRSGGPARGGGGGGGSFRPRFSGGRGGGNKRRGNFGGNIDVSMFVKKAVNVAPEKAVEIKHAFADFDFCPELKANLARKGFETPTPIQDQSIPAILNGRDIVGLANTGTGKTGAFLLPLIEKVFKDPSQKVLIIAPTRELALQIDNEFKLFAFGMKMYSAVCVGGMPIFRQMNDLRRNPHFVIGTPGRLKDLNDRRCINFSLFNNIVLDEVDHMLDMGFIDDIRNILNQIPAKRQSLFFSATMPARIRELVNQFVKDPFTAEIKSGKTSDNVEQDVIRVKDRSMKFNELKNLLGRPELAKVLIFSETKRDVEQLANDLIDNGFKAESIHGDKRQRERQRALTQFRTNIVTILVATDVAARGLDIKDITHVINYTVPQTYDDYIHRIGRTGRGNSKGTALTFV